MTPEILELAMTKSILVVASNESLVGNGEHALLRGFGDLKSDSPILCGCI